MAPDKNPISPTPLLTKERLARDIEALAKACQDPELGPMIRKAREGWYDDYDSPEATPQMNLAADFRRMGYEGMARKAIDGLWDGTKAESDAWAARQTDPEILATLRLLEGKQAHG